MFANVCEWSVATHHEDSSDGEGYEEREASRQHSVSVKFSEDSMADRDVSTL